MELVRREIKLFLDGWSRSELSSEGILENMFEISSVETINYVTAREFAVTTTLTN